MFSFFTQLKKMISSSNKYVLAVSAFLIWMIFLDTNKLSTHWKLNKKIKHLTNQVEDYKALIEQAKKDAIDLEVNKEKYAREKYYMHTPGEDVYIVKEK